MKDNRPYSVVSFMDSKTAPLNPCSVETIPLPIQLRDGTMGWPTVVSCYELVEERNERVGHMEFSFIRLSSHKSEEETEIQELLFPEDTVTVMDPSTSSGILDGAWLQPHKDKLVFYFATAHSSGCIQIHHFKFLASDDEQMESNNSLFRHSLIGHSTVPTIDDDKDTSDSPAPLCLSVRWSAQQQGAPSFRHEVVSTYSNGMVAVHQVIPTTTDIEPCSSAVQLVLVQAWLAHTLFRTTPAEVWSASFAANNTSLVFSGGDDRKLKGWDLRAGCNSPTVVLDDCFDAGVTCIEWHPQQEHRIAVGSYDEVVRLFDARYLQKRKPLAQSGPLGGIWRIKWHPLSPQRMLVAAMHGGCHVLEFDEDKLLAGGCLESSAVDCKCITTFTEHKSMAYGADWLIYPPASSGVTPSEAAVSCSFYDRALFLWDAASQRSARRV